MSTCWDPLAWESRIVFSAGSGASACWRGPHLRAWPRIEPEDRRAPCSGRHPTGLRGAGAESEPVRYTSTSGVAKPIYTACDGKVLLAFMGEDSRHEIMRADAVHRVRTRRSLTVTNSVSRSQSSSRRLQRQSRRTGRRRRRGQRSGVRRPTGTCGRTERPGPCQSVVRGDCRSDRALVTEAAPGRSRSALGTRRAWIVR